MRIPPVRKSVDVGPLPDRATCLIIAAKLNCDPRTAARLIVHGPDALHVRWQRERARALLAELGITPSEGSAA